MSDLSDVCVSDGFFAFKEEQKIAKAAGQLEIDAAYLYFRHESNYFKKGHPELLLRIKKVRPL